MSSTNSTNLPQMSVDKFVSLLSESYSKIINNGLEIKSFPSVMLWGGSWCREVKRDKTNC